MEIKEDKNGCLKGIFISIIVLIAFYIVGNIYISILDFLAKIFSNPYINYGVPIILLILLYIKTKNNEK